LPPMRVSRPWARWRPADISISTTRDLSAVYPWMFPAVSAPTCSLLEAISGWRSIPAPRRRRYIALTSIPIPAKWLKNLNKTPSPPPR